MIRIAICDDETGTCTEIETMILHFAKSHALSIETEVFYSGEAFCRSLRERCLFDLVFLDIQLLQMDGVQVGKQVREQLGNEKISIVFISAKETYAMQLFQVRPLDFLIKPIAKARIFTVLETFLKVNADSRNAFQFQIGKSIYRQYLSEIRYFACNGRKIELYTDCGCEVFYGTMQKVWQQVEGKGFLAIHKSYIVNTAFVSVYHYDSVRMTDGTCLPISQKYRKSVKQQLTALFQRG